MPVKHFVSVAYASLEHESRAHLRSLGPGGLNAKLGDFGFSIAQKSGLYGNRCNEFCLREINPSLNEPRPPAPAPGCAAMMRYALFWNYCGTIPHASPD